MIKFFRKIRKIIYGYKAAKRISKYLKAIEEDRMRKAKEREKALVFPEGKDPFEEIKAIND